MLALLVVKDNAPGQRRALRLGVVSRVTQALRKSGFKVRKAARKSLKGSYRADLVVSAGGDGTLLATARRIEKGQVLLGVNTDSLRSVGFLCGATGQSFPRVLRDWLSGKHPPKKLRRLRVVVAGGFGRRCEKVLNDILVTSRHPAGTSRYSIRLRAGNKYRSEAQRGSGLWIATASGSTAAIRAAGGRPMKDEASAFQYRVREPYVRPGSGAYRLTGGIMGPKDSMTVISRMDGVIYVDGPRVEIPFPRGAVLRVTLDPEPIHLIR